MNNRRRWTAAIFTFVLGDAIALQMRGAVLPRVAADFEIPEALLGLVAPAGTLGFLLAVLAVGLVAGHLPIRRTMLAGLGVAIFALLAMALAPVYVLFLGFLLIQGTADGVGRALDRPVLSHLYPDQRGRTFNLYAMAWAVGGASAPLLANAVIAVADWRLVFSLVAALFVVPVALLARATDLESVAGERQLTVARLREVMSDPAVLGMAAALVFSGGIEGSLFTWLPYFASQRVTESQANLVLSGVLVSYIPARAAYGLVIERFEYLAVTFVLAVVATPLVYLAFTTESIAVFVAAIVATGVAVSSFFPTLSAFGVDEHPAYSGPISAIATGANYLGMSLFPPLVGLASSYVGLGTALSLLAGAFVCLGAIIAATAWQRRASPSS
ncbi:major facilitator superfamily MFS 1 protein [Halorhabdus tiamatea SARL4B]|uniref:Major facilitator superfamily MFS 1 protein n=1 Tax=Halorhabdus tiamatea SARL4B TaxID=1033806 RepID=F7PIS0_9EURY|nr:MFS transporter [Halorhabdus tiamatea]ERJ05413.1 major facilitator superfamily MFS 1 protein [Halorhabdus tiamatea SARL4B]CCQ33361.1 major facilitator superfamily MFS_1 [Halorhabdus tiamatea SARL4B]